MEAVTKDVWYNDFIRLMFMKLRFWLENTMGGKRPRESVGSLHRCVGDVWVMRGVVGQHAGAEGREEDMLMVLSPG